MCFLRKACLCYVDNAAAAGMLGKTSILSLFTNVSLRSTEPSQRISYTFSDHYRHFRKPTLPSLDVKRRNLIPPTDGAHYFL